MGMTEREQVIAELLYLKRDCLEGSATDQTLDKTLALLKAQEPVSPVFERQFMSSIELYNCGRCGTSVGAKGIAKYCMKCGQAVKWE